jgi:hypothetical protein
VSDMRQVEDAKLRELERIVMAELGRPHVVVQWRKLVRDEHGVPLKDSGPVLNAVKELRVIGERRARLFGVDAPLRKVLSVITEDVVQKEIDRIASLADSIEAEFSAEEADR